MIAIDEDALICDFAEYYKVYDYMQLPVHTAAVFACGLPPDSRIMRKLTGARCSMEQLLLANIADRLSMLLYAMAGGEKSKMQRPRSLAEILTGTEQKKKDGPIEGFRSVDAFEDARRKAMRG